MITPAFTALLVGLAPQVPPQGLHSGLVPGGTTSQSSRVEFPTQPSLAKVAPFSDATGQPQPTDAAAVGAADFDGDGNEDLWFLSASGTNQGELSVEMARGSSLLRYRDWHTFPARTWEHGATFRSTDYPFGDRVVLVERQQTDLVSASYSYPFGGNPQAGTFVVNASWTVGLGAYEVATRDDDGDGHDDIAVLLEPQPGWTRIKKLCMGTTLGWVRPEKEVTCDIPVVANSLRMLDVDNDGRSDVLVRLSTTGVLLLRDDGQRLVPTTLLILPMPADDVFVGDADGNEYDDFGLVFSSGILLARAQAKRFDPLWLQAPAGIGPLGSAAVVGDVKGVLGTIAAFSVDGQSAVLFPSVGFGFFGPAETLLPPEPGEYQGSGTVGVPFTIADVDGDDDEDIVMQLADRTHWVAVENTEGRLAPQGVQVVDFGFIGETGYRKYGLIAQVPQEALQEGLTTVELAVFLEDVTAQPPTHIYWGRLLAPANPNTHTVAFTVYSQTEKGKLQTMIMNGDVHRFPGGITTGGQSLLSIHFKNGTVRHSSLLIHHDPDEANKSAIGPKWHSTTAPPEPAMDSDLLPWN